MAQNNAQSGNTFATVSNEPTTQKSQVALNEERILAYWHEKKIFEKTLEQTAEGKEFIFYDGPPFATGAPHYGHVIPGTMKDMIPRFKTMQGYHVKRQWGWDCHGLPVENLIEKELGLTNKKDIEAYGVEKFNTAARNSVMRYAGDWQRIIPRTGRFVDMQHDYKTMDTGYTESVWWAFHELYKKQLIYEGFKIMPYCPRCGTTLSNFEVNQGYKDITDISVYVKFKRLEKDSVKHKKVSEINAKETHKSTDEIATYFLAWTTTPWTLPGNVALAVHPQVDYVKIKVGNSFYILAKGRLSVIKETYEIIEEFKGEKIIGESYQTVFPYYLNKIFDYKEHAWKIYGADFVTTEDGTGIVHIAPAFGGDDYELALKEKLPVIIHVNKEGIFKDEVTDFKGQTAKPKDDHQKGDVEIIKYLAHENLLFAKEKIVHSYPHCWRCDTPLLNYASSSWFVKVTDLKDKLIKENEQINWIPSHIKEGRFGKWLEGARDWAISRTRYWGAPLPVWKCDECENEKVLGSIEDIKEKTKSSNLYTIVRHGESENNVRNIINSNISHNTFALTEHGKSQAESAAKALRNKTFDVVFVSPFLRAQQTAEIICKNLGIESTKVITDPRLSEVNGGIFDGKSVDDFHNYFLAHPDRFSVTPEGGENYSDVRKRTLEFLYEIDEKYTNKHILIITHDTPIWLLFTGACGMSIADTVSLRGTSKFFLDNAEVKEFLLYRLPRNEKFELDLHRPYIDEITFDCVCGKGKMKRIPDVFDTWFDSGSMVFARHHYMGKPLADFNPQSGLLHKAKGFPADFIAEGQDQTRGWFYTLIVLSTALFGKAPYKNVIVNGLLLAEDGRKMSKSLKNYPEINYILGKYGADALRYFLMSSPLVHAEDVNFSEKEVDEVYKKCILRLNNVVSFFEMYKEKNLREQPLTFTSTNILDQWIVARLHEVINETTSSLEKYELDRAVWPFDSFIDDLSTWYLRRSRERFKNGEEQDKKHALSTLRYILVQFSKVIAPVMPFIADDIYLKMEGPQESVHLETWPKTETVDFKLIATMKRVRDLVTLALEARSKSLIKVRQPLAKLSIKTEEKLSKELLDLIKEEVNVKEVVEDASLTETLFLDTQLTPELKLEGNYRELLRATQELRKTHNLVPSELITLHIETSTEGLELVKKFETDFKKTAGIAKVVFAAVPQGEEVKVGDLIFRLEVVK